MIQFGYIAFFSAVQPISIVGTGLSNLLEIRADAFKLLFQTRRPRYRGADGIGTWRSVIAAFSLMAVVINAMVIVITSTTIRDKLIVPQVANTDECELTTDEEMISDEGRFLSVNYSFESDCSRNYLNCYADIGGVEWLPAAEFLTNEDVTSRHYYETGLCDPSSTLYSAAHCKTCERRRNEVNWWLTGCFLAVENVLLVMHLLVAVGVPDKPKWVTADEARAEFRSDQLQQAPTAWP